MHSRALHLAVVFIAMAGCTRAGVRKAKGDTGRSDLGALDLPSDTQTASHDLRTDGPAPSFAITSFALQWRTPTTLRWRFRFEGAEADFATSRLLVAKDPTALAGSASTARVFDATSNPELGVFTLPFTSGPDRVEHTIATGLSPSTTYFAQLRVADKGGKEVRSAVVSATTQAPPTRSIAVFDDAKPPGYTIPGSFARQTGAGAHGGNAYYAYTSSCQPGQSACFENLRWQGLGGDLTALAAEFDAAFIEVALSCTGSHSYWSQARIMLRDGGGGDTIYGAAPLTFRCDGGYQRLEIPLGQLRRGIHNALLTHAELAGRELHEVGFGGRWAEGATVRMDSCALRW